MKRQPGRLRVVFDCNILVQTIAFEGSPAAQAVGLLESGAIDAFVSRDTLSELRRVLAYPEVLEMSPHMTPARIGAFFKRFLYRATLLRPVSAEFSFERDPDDEPYLNLAWAAKADFIVTRDADLLWLMKGHTRFCKDFRRKTHPLEVLNPLHFLEAMQQPRP